MTDKFFSGWGCAEGRTNKLVLECDSYEEAEIVAQNGRNRTEMKNVNICINKPRYNEHRYKISEHNKSDYQSWYVKGYFKAPDR